MYNSRREAKHTQSREECRRAGGQPNTLSRQAHSEPGGEVEGSARAVKHTQSRGERWRGARGQSSILRAGGRC